MAAGCALKELAGQVPNRFGGVNRKLANLRLSSARWQTLSGNGALSSGTLQASPIWRSGSRKDRSLTVAAR